MIKEFNIGDRVHLVPQYHPSKDYTFERMDDMPDSKYEAIIKRKRASTAPQGKIAQKFGLPKVLYVLEFIDSQDADRGYSYSIEMFQEFYTLNNINPQTLEIITTITTEDIPINKDVLTESANNTESFTLNNNITIKF